MKNYIVLFILFFSTISLANTWQQKASFGGVGRHRGTGISIANKGYIGLGHVNGTGIDISYKDWWQYDPASNSWTQKANFPVNNHGAIAFSTDTKGYVGGGSALNQEFYEFNPQTNTWSPIANCPLSPGDVQVFSVKNKGYVYSGDQLAEYNPTSNSWTMKANAPVFFGSWSNSFGTESSGFVKSGTNFYEYKPANNQWIQRTSFPGLMSNGSAAFTMNDKGYFTSGYVGSLSNVTEQVWEFNPGTNEWTMVTDFPGTSRRFSVAFSINNKGYFGTGTNGINLNDFWQFFYDPLDLDEFNLENIQVSIFPNPAINNVNLKFEGIDITLLNKCSLTIYSSDGRLISSQQIDGQTMQLEREDKQTGIYFYSIIYKANKIYTGKIIYY